MGRVEGKEVVKRILQGLVSAARILVFWTSGTFGPRVAGLSRTWVGVGSVSGVGGRDGGASR